MQRENFINVETNFINAEKYIRLLWNSNMNKHSDLAFKFRKHDFTRCFMRKQWIFLKNGEWKIIYREKRVYNFLNNAKQKIILCQNARNSLCRKQWTIFMRKKWTILLNAKSKSIYIYKTEAFEASTNFHVNKILKKKKKQNQKKKKKIPKNKQRTTMLKKKKKKKKK